MGYSPHPLIKSPPLLIRTSFNGPGQGDHLRDQFHSGTHVMIHQGIIAMIYYRSALFCHTADSL